MFEDNGYNRLLCTALNPTERSARVFHANYYYWIEGGRMDIQRPLISRLARGTEMCVTKRQKLFGWNSCTKWGISRLFILDHYSYIVSRGAHASRQRQFITAFSIAFVMQPFIKQDATPFGLSLIIVIVVIIKDIIVTIATIVIIRLATITAYYNTIFRWTGGTNIVRLSSRRGI